jgi:putative Ca2+/H+ antiporter (TMEM165/GDT1 family)
MSSESSSPAEHPRRAWFTAFITTFTTVFLAELGDKTQLAALLLSAQSGRPLLVFVGASLALICSSLVGVLLGRWLARAMPAHQLERLAGLQWWPWACGWADRRRFTSPPCPATSP